MRLQSDLRIIHLADWIAGRHRVIKDPVLLVVMREHGMIIVGFDRRTMAVQAGQLTRAGMDHAGVILLRRSVSQMDYGKQARLLVESWREAANEDWADRIEYLPRQ